MIIGPSILGTSVHDHHCEGPWRNGQTLISTGYLLPCVTMIIPTLRKVMTPARKTITESKISALNCFFFRFEMIPAFNIFVLGMFA